MADDHVFVVAEGASQEEPRAHWWCKHCNERVAQPLPMKVDTWLEMSRGFTKAHRKCTPSKEA